MTVLGDSGNTKQNDNGAGRPILKNGFTEH